MTIYFNSIEDKQNIYDLCLRDICCNKPVCSWVNPVTEFYIDVDSSGTKRLIVKSVHTMIKKLLDNSTFDAIMNI